MRSVLSERRRTPVARISRLTQPDRWARRHVWTGTAPRAPEKVPRFFGEKAVSGHAASADDNVPVQAIRKATRLFRALSFSLAAGFLVPAVGHAQDPVKTGDSPTPSSPEDNSTEPATATAVAPAGSSEPGPPAPATPSPVDANQPASPPEVKYDEVVVKGVKLQGRITAFGEKSITFETIYGKGSIEILYTDLEQISTHGSYRFIESNGDSVTGRVASLSSRDLVIATHTGDVKLIKPANVQRVVPDVEMTNSLADRLHNRFPFTTVKVDFGWNLESGAVKKVLFEGGLTVERRKAPTRLELEVRAAYETEQDADAEPTVSKDEYRATLIGEYDLKGPWYTFGLPAAERDATRNILLRFYPSAGVGYRLVETGKLRFQIQAGLAYVYEDFIDYPKNEYAALHFGFEGGYDFSKNYGVTWKTYYYPGLDGLSTNWLFRSELTLSARITQTLSLSLRISDTLDNTPSPDVGDNKITSTLSLAFTF
jgi:putative salt-induced outer membrane protein YdiY